MFRRYVLCALLLLSSVFVYATPYDIHIRGNTASTTITLPGGYEVDVVLSFENVMGLTAENLNITAYVANPLSLDMLNRLPTSLVSLQAAYPVVVSVKPLAESGFSFSGAITFDFHTHNLQYSVNTPLRLFKSHDGGIFEDITVATGAGSIRARGTSGNLSDFIIVADLRPVSQVITSKVDKLEQLVAQFSSQIAPELLSSLQYHASLIRQMTEQANYPAALIQTRSLLQLIDEAAVSQMPDVWRSARDIDNVAGMLKASGETLAYSLRLAL